MKKSFTIRDWDPSTRPRERLQNLGSEALSDIELLAIIMGSGGKGEPVLRLAERLLNEYGSLRAIANASVEELSQIKGIGLAKATQVKAALELGTRRANRPDTNNKITVNNPNDAIDIVKNRLRDKKKEYFVLLMFDTRKHFIRDADVSIGSLDASIVHPREVFKEAISASAASVILVHNHPSGDSAPSDDDIKITKRLIEVGKLVDIEVIDHIIIGREKCLSMKAEKII